MTEYSALNANPTKKVTRIFGIILGASLIFIGIFIQSLYSAIVGTIIILAVIYRKELLFNEEGYVTRYDFLLFHHEDCWKYADLYCIHRDPAPNIAYMGLLLQKDMAVKRAIILINHVEPVLELAKTKNPSLFIDDIKQ